MHSRMLQNDSSLRQGQKAEWESVSVSAALSFHFKSNNRISCADAHPYHAHRNTHYAYALWQHAKSSKVIWSPSCDIYISVRAHVIYILSFCAQTMRYLYLRASTTVHVCICVSVHAFQVWYGVYEIQWRCAKCCTHLFGIIPSAGAIRWRFIVRNLLVEFNKSSTKSAVYRYHSI